jgi:acyl-CoA thioesterase-1
MKKIIFILFFLSLTQAPAVYAEPKKLVVLGDSITEGLGVAKSAAFPSLLEAKLNQKKTMWTVINSGVSGSTTASAPGRIKWMLKNKPDVVLIVLGANDGLRGLKIEQSEKNLSEAIQMAQEVHIKVILGGLYMPPNYGKDYTEKFKNMYLHLAKKYKLFLVPFILDKVAGNPKYTQPDGLHPNEEGHKVVAETIYQAIKDQL